MGHALVLFGKPAVARHHFVTPDPEASDISYPPCLLRLLSAGANRRVGLAPTYLGHWCQAEIFSIADCIFAEVVDGVGVINGSFAIAANSDKCAGRPRFCHCGKDRINLSPVRSSGP